MMFFIIRKKKRAIFIFLAISGVVAAGLILPSALPRSRDERRYYWQGTIDVRTWAEGAPCLTGVFDTSWKVNVKWEERDRIDVRDRKGSLVGQFVRFKDAGSTWSGKESGTFVHDGPGWVRRNIYSGAGSGTGNVFVDAVVYFSLSEEDPLKDVLPNGAYAINTATPAIAAFDTAIRHITTHDDGRVSESSINFQKIAMLRYCIGELALGLNSRRWAQSVVAEDIKPYVQGVDMEGYDNVMRSLSDGRMQGSYDNKSDFGRNLGRSRSLHNVVSWDIRRRLVVQAELKKVPREWRPMGGPQKNSVQVTARIEPGQDLKGKFRFTLFEVSKEKGWAMNAGKETTFDLLFAAGQAGFQAPTETGDGSIVEGTETVEEARVTVDSLDYGAWGRLKAEVNIDGEWYTCTAEDGKDSITIPLDDNGDRIQDKWMDDWSITGQSATDDKDAEPDGVGDPGNPGDGFTNFEEYRGFVAEGKWTEGVPDTKELFIYDEIGCGFGHFTTLGLQVYKIYKDEYDGSRVVNFNRGYATAGEQKGLYLHEGDLAGLSGTVSPCVGSPNVVDEVIIDSSEVLPSDAYSISDSLASLVAHELGHGVNIMHHGEDWADWTGHAGDITDAEARNADRDWVAGRGGKWSGNLSCIMLYRPPDFYVGTDGKLYRYPESECQIQRILFCSDRAGTGCNAGSPRRGANGEPYPVAGNATWGACRKSVDIKGRHTNGDRW
jgi:hypothetical protein